MHSLPAAVADLPATALADVLGGPTLFDLRRAGAPPLFVSALLHGNEISGWEALRRLAPRLASQSAMVFLGNVEAARESVRALPGRVDFNRIWEGSAAPEADVAAEVVEIATAAQPRLAVDLHNNTGRNPPYSVICRTDQPTLDAAFAFSRRALYAEQPHGFLTRRFARFCTAMTIEAGMPTEPQSTARTLRFLSNLVDGVVPVVGAAKCGLTVFRTVARVSLAADAVLDPDAQRYNFHTAPAGAALTLKGALTATDAAGREVGAVYFRLVNGVTVLTRPADIAMYTGDPASARHDCLCYLLEPAETHA